MDKRAQQKIREINFVDFTHARHTESKLSSALAYSWNSWNSLSKKTSVKFVVKKSTSETCIILLFVNVPLVIDEEDGQRAVRQ